jgi:hypothetical protein
MCVIGSSPVEASETVESLTLDCSALLLVELMMIEKRGWQLWKCLSSRINLTSSSSSSSVQQVQSSTCSVNELSRNVLMKLIGMALNRLSALTPSSWAPAEFGGNQVRPIFIQVIFFF